MKIVCVIDSINQISNKIDMLKSRFGDNILYVVKANFANIVKTYNIKANAVYYHDLSKTIHVLLAKGEVTDVIIYYTSLDLTDQLINNFILAIAEKDNIVNFKPEYNFFEKLSHSIYNLYVKSLFKCKDSLISPKLQFLPKSFVETLLDSHFGNRLFETNKNLTKTLTPSREQNKAFKVGFKFSRFALIPIIIALALTIALLSWLRFLNGGYLVGVVFTLLYILDIVLSIIFFCKQYFDKRFFK